MLGFYEYSSRKPQPRQFKHTSASRYDANCLCPSCCAEYRRQHPEEYAVFQSQPTPNAKVTDLTSAEFSATMKVLTTFSASCYVPKVDSRTSIKVKNAPRKSQYVQAAVILAL